MMMTLITGLSFSFTHPENFFKTQALFSHPIASHSHNRKTFGFIFTTSNWSKLQNNHPFFQSNSQFSISRDSDFQRSVSIGVIFGKFQLLAYLTKKILKYF